MKTINTYFFNYCSPNPNGQPLKKHLNTLGHDIITDKTKQPELIMSSVYGSLDWIEKYPKAIKVLYSNESLHYSHYKKITDKLYLFDYFIGDCNYNNFINWYRVPSFYLAHSIYNKNNRYYKQIINNEFNIKNKTKNICLVSRNPHHLRLKILDKLKCKNIIVDCPGKVGNNMASISNSWDDKISFLSQYYINICPENSYLEDYITEKILHASLANCIPVYWGCEHLEHGLYNKDKILLISKDQSNIDTIIDKIEFLINHPKDLKELCSLLPFDSNIFVKKLNEIDESLLKLCQQIIDRIK
jgi:hypothetical protein